MKYIISQQCLLSLENECALLASMVAREPQVGDTEAISITEVSQEELSHYTFWRIEGCGHWFREGNLRQWYQACSDPACPSCRREFYPSDVRWVEPTQKHNLRGEVRARERGALCRFTCLYCSGCAAAVPRPTSVSHSV